ncbi:VWA domain-containing protein [Terriglobus roseus]|uniref:VWFA-related domain-containing protein n=1 Tax=Terriglobus roseus TaxID=392734 RepID=A0A1G7I2T7_9BACT|nr:VWA domain-containing protein [Terriglobus roseus]SDF06776.1 VWFA-related domain-containing protein [Terriglobus roseus]
MMRFAAAALLLCVPLLSQQHEPHLKSLEDRKAEWRAEHHIILNLVMKDASGAPASHLSQQDIVLLDNGKPQPLESFREMTGLHSLEPVHVVVVLDTVNNSRKDLTEQQKSLESFLESTSGTLPYPTSLALVTDAATSVGEATRDSASLTAQLKELPLTSHMEEGYDTSAFGRSNSVELSTIKKEQSDGAARSQQLSNLNRRFQRSIPALEYLAHWQQDSPGRCLLFWLGRGWPMLTESEFTSDSARTQLGYFDSVVALTNALRAAQITVYNVGYPHASGSGYKGFLADVTSEHQATAGNLSLQVFAIHTGGAVMDHGSLGDQIRSGLADATPYYSVAFDAQAAHTLHEHHAIRVTVSGRPDISVSTDSAFYDEP